jgi:LEA14-like dessication related protein
MRNFIFFFALFLFLAACTRPEEIPVFKRVADIRVSKISGTDAELNANAYFYNPNDVKMTLRKVDIVVSLEGKKIGKINHSERTKVPALSDFTIPVNATFNLNDVGVLKSILNVLGGNKMKAHYKGYIKLTVHNIPIKVPVDYEEEIRLR